MKENERLQEVLEQAEDAYFEVVMSAYAEQLGAEYLAEAKRLNADSSFEYPEELDRKCRTQIERAGKQRKLQSFRRGLKKVANVAAVIVAIIALSGTVLFMTVEAFRAETLNFLVKTFAQEEGTTARAGEASEDNWASMWMPEDCVRVKAEHGKSLDKYTYLDREGRQFVLTCLNGHGAVTLDTEFSNTEYLEIGAFKAYYSEKDGTNSLTWVDTANDTIYTLNSVELLLEDLLALAESFYS